MNPDPNLWGFHEITYMHGTIWLTEFHAWKQDEIIVWNYMVPCMEWHGIPCCGGSGKVSSIDGVEWWWYWEQMKAKSCTASVHSLKPVLFPRNIWKVTMVNKDFTFFETKTMKSFLFSFLALSSLLLFVFQMSCISKFDSFRSHDRKKSPHGTAFEEFDEI